VQGAFFRISIIADDHYSVDLARYMLGVWTNRVYIYAGRANLPHGMPFGSHFTNWVRQEYGASLTPSTYTISVANTSATGGGDWIAVDWIELHLLLY
jgi:hypothetical protein